MVKSTAEELIQEARGIISKRNLDSFLAVSDDFVHEGEWFHIIVFPNSSSVSALDYVDAIEDIEQILRKKFGDEILVVPTKS